MLWSINVLLISGDFNTLTKTMSFEEQVMSKDKYTSMFLHKIEAIVFIILQIFFNASKKLFANSYLSAT